MFWYVESLHYFHNLLIAFCARFLARCTFHNGFWNSHFFDFRNVSIDSSIFAPPTNVHPTQGAIFPTLPITEPYASFVISSAWPFSFPVHSSWLCKPGYHSPWVSHSSVFWRVRNRHFRCLATCFDGTHDLGLCGPSLRHCKGRLLYTSISLQRHNDGHQFQVVLQGWLLTDYLLMATLKCYCFAFAYSSPIDALFFAVINTLSF